MIAGPVTTHSWIWPSWWQVVIDVLVVALVIGGLVRWRRRRRS
jgi:MYXO-CTERM domain-containing protein